MIGLIFWILAIICLSVIFTLHHHFGVSVFNGLNDSWWNPYESWKRKYKNVGKLVPKYSPVLQFIYVPFSDAYHTFKTAFLTCLILMVASLIIWTPDVWVVILYVVSYPIIYNLFYHKIWMA